MLGALEEPAVANPAARRELLEEWKKAPRLERIIQELPSKEYFLKLLDRPHYAWKVDEVGMPLVGTRRVVVLSIKGGVGKTTTVAVAGSMLAGLRRDKVVALDASSDWGTLAARLSVVPRQSVRDLAASNVFPGDLLLKNFGVTSHGRVIFYDYDEICLVSDCVFRDLPQASCEEEVTSAEPWPGAACE